MSQFDRFMKKVDAGRKGDVVCIPLGLPRLAEHVTIQQDTYYMLGANPGIGKSAVVHDLFVLQPYEWMLANPTTHVKLKIFVFSLERKEEFYIAKWICHRLFTKHGILVHPRLILGMVPGISVPDRVFKLIEAEKAFFDTMLSSTVTLISRRTTAPALDKVIREWAEANGTWDESTHRYTPNDPNLITIILLDHLGRVVKTPGATDKATLDYTSSVLQKAKDRYGFSPVAVCQFNRASADMNRRKMTNFLPEQQDFKGSGNMYEDAEVVFSLFHPRQYGLTECFGFNIGDFDSASGFNRFRLATVLKNSLGADNINVPLNFIGEGGNIRELPRPDLMGPQEKFWAANPARKAWDGTAIAYSFSQQKGKFSYGK